MLPGPGKGTEIVVKKNEHKKSDNAREFKKTYNWTLTINLVPFENDAEREKAYNSWVRSFFETD